jgi:hypothetical protein
VPQSESSGFFTMLPLLIVDQICRIRLRKYLQNDPAAQALPPSPHQTAC